MKLIKHWKREDYPNETVFRGYRDESTVIQLWEETYDDHFHEITKWCDEQFGPPMIVWDFDERGKSIHFYRRDDAVCFRLRWC